MLIVPLSLHQYYFNCFGSELELTKGLVYVCMMLVSVLSTISPVQWCDDDPEPGAQHQPGSPHTSTCQNCRECLEPPPRADLPLSGQLVFMFTLSS